MNDPYSTERNPLPSMSQHTSRNSHQSQPQQQQREYTNSRLPLNSNTSNAIPMLTTPSNDGLIPPNLPQGIPAPSVSIPPVHKEQQRLSQTHQQPTTYPPFPIQTPSSTSATSPIAPSSSTSILNPTSQQTLYPPQPVSESAGERGNDGALVCQWGDCSRVFPDHSLLATHLSEDHVGWKKGGYQCDWNNCSRQGVKCHNRFALMMHLRIHTGEKPFECTTCGQSFGRQDALTRHKKADHGEIVVIENSKAAGTAPTVPTVPPPGTIFADDTISPSSKPSTSSSPTRLVTTTAAAAAAETTRPSVIKSVENKSPVKRQSSATADPTLSSKNTAKKQKTSNTKSVPYKTALSTTITVNSESDKAAATDESIPSSDYGRETTAVYDDEETEEEDFQQTHGIKRRVAHSPPSVSTSTTSSSLPTHIPNSSMNKSDSTPTPSRGSGSKLITSKKDSDYSQYRLAKAQLAYLMRENAMLQDEYEVVHKKLKRLSTERKVLLDVLVGQTEPASMQKKNDSAVRRTNHLNEEDKSDIDTDTDDDLGTVDNGDIPVDDGDESDGTDRDDDAFIVVE